MVHIANVHALCVGGVWVCAWMRTCAPVCMCVSHLCRGLGLIPSILFAVWCIHINSAEMIQSLISLLLLLCSFILQLNEGEGLI